MMRRSIDGRCCAEILLTSRLGGQDQGARPSAPERAGANYVATSLWRDRRHHSVERSAVCRNHVDARVVQALHVV